MRINRILLFLLASFTLNSAFSQLYISPGATIHMSGNALLYSGSEVINKGTLNGGNGTVVCNSHLNDSNTINASSALLIFNGSSNQNAVFANSSLYRVSINKSSGNVTFLSNVPTISDSLFLLGGLAIISNQQLRTKTTTAGASNTYVKTSGTGRLLMPLVSGASKSFPVGLSSFNPVTITNNTGVADSAGVRVLDEVYDSGNSGSAISRARVKRTWEILRNNTNAGSGYNFTFNWDAASAVSLTQPKLYAFVGNLWVQLNGTTSVSGNTLTYSGYTGNATLFSIQQNCEPVSSTQSFTTCNSYTWNGQTYTQSGTYTWTGTNASGCDSIVTLNLTISAANAKLFNVDSISHCGASYALSAGAGYSSYLWSTGSTTSIITATTSKWYVCTVNQNGCTFTDSVYLQITNPASIPVPASITIQSIQTNVCGSRKYRYIAPALPVNATGYQWSFVGSLFNESATIDSGTLNSRIITVTYSSNSGCGAGDSIKLRYNTVCGFSNWRALKLSNTVLLPPNAPASITVQSVAQSNCGARRFRYIAPLLPAATASNSAATAWQWEFAGSLSEFATIDSGDENSRIIVVVFSTNAAAQSGDSIKLYYQSDCGLSKAKATKLTNVKLNTPVTPSCYVLQAVQTNVCGIRKYRFIAPALPAASLTSGAATGWLWSMPIGTVGSTAVLDSGTLTSKVIILRFSSNAAAGIGDSIKLRYNSECGYSPFRTMKLINTALNPPMAPASITIQSVATNICGIRKYRYIAPALPAASATNGVATGWQWTMPIGTLGATATLDSGSLTGRIIVLQFTSNAAATIVDSIKLRYNSDCGFGPFRAMKLSNTLLSAPLAPASITMTLVQNDCGARIYRYSAPALCIATTVNGAATGYEWTMPFGPLGSQGTLDSGTLTSRTIRIIYPSNEASQAGDSIRVRYNSVCGLGLNKTLKLSNTVKTGCPPVTKPAIPYSKTTENQPKTNQLSVLLYPNPSADQFYVKLSSESKSKVMIRIFDMQGKRVQQLEALPNGVTQIGNGLKSGTYMMQVHQDGEVKTIKLVKI